MSLSGGALTSIVILIVVTLGLLLILLWYFWLRNRRRKQVTPQDRLKLAQEHMKKELDLYNEAKTKLSQIRFEHIQAAEVGVGVSEQPQGHEGQEADASAPAPVATSASCPFASQALYDAMVAAVENEQYVKDYLYECHCREEAEKMGVAPNDAAFAHPMNTCLGGSDPRAEYQRQSEWISSAPAKPGIKTEKSEMQMLPFHFWVCRGVVLPSKGDQALALAKRLEQRERDLVYKEVKEQPLNEVTPASGDHASQGLLAYSELLPFMISAVHGDWRKDKFVALCHFMHCPLVDRTQTLQAPLRLIIQHPIPVRDPTFKRPLEELMCERARELLAASEAEGKALDVLWSGGLDTTGAVVAFLRVTEDRPEDRLRIRIRYREDSLGENPDFFDQVIRPNFENTLVISGHVRDVLYDGSTDDRLLVTGDPCDMLFGTFMMASSFKSRYDVEGGLLNPLHGQLDAPWRETLPAALHAKGLLLGTNDDPKDEDVYSRVAAEWVTWIEPFMQKAPIPVESTFDALWWMVYGLKYQHDLLRIFYNSPEEQVPEGVRSRVRNFYEPEPFHQWSFNFHEQKMANHCVWATYKWPLKLFVRAHVSQEYFANKIKVVSTRNSFGLECGYDHNWRAVKFGLFSISFAKLVKKYGSGEPQRLLERFCDPMYMHTFGTMPLVGVWALAIFYARSWFPPRHGGYGE